MGMGSQPISYIVINFIQVFLTNSFKEFPSTGSSSKTVLSTSNDIVNQAIYINPNKIRVNIFKFEVSKDIPKIIKINYGTKYDNTCFLFIIVHLPNKKVNGMPATSPPYTTFRLVFSNRYIHHVPWSTPSRTHVVCKILEGLPLVLPNI